MPHQMLRENGPWPRVPILDWHWELYDVRLVPYTHYPSIIPSFAKKNRREIVWFQIYVYCAGPIFNLNLYVPGIFCLQVENWVVVVPKGLFLFKFQLKLKET